MYAFINQNSISSLYLNAFFLRNYPLFLFDSHLQVHSLSPSLITSSYIFASSYITNKKQPNNHQKIQG